VFANARVSFSSRDEADVLVVLEDRIFFAEVFRLDGFAAGFFEVDVLEFAIKVAPLSMDLMIKLREISKEE
jgi:hypothetical protein